MAPCPANFDAKTRGIVNRICLRCGDGVRRCCGKAQIVPGKLLRLLPLRLAAAAAYSTSDPHARRHDVLAHFAHDPDAGMVHLHQRRDALGRSQAKHGDKLRLSHLVAIERDDLELMPGKSDPVHFRRA